MVPVTASAQTNQQCLNWAIYKEARGEGLLTQKAVSDVVMNRVKKSGKSVCQVLRQPFQFPYFAKGVGQVPRKFLTRMYILSNMQSVVPHNVLYFNDTKLPFGEHHIKLGNMFFNKEK